MVRWQRKVILRLLTTGDGIGECESEASNALRASGLFHSRAAHSHHTLSDVVTSEVVGVSHLTVLVHLAALTVAQNAQIP